ncbi:MAG: carboxypeptidase regulatory-like domain-containing protein [Bryobacterales bacterium]|nr:carboxypeptidase regulatory-like domain-containing protein [Bryobacterales bacterium]
MKLPAGLRAGRIALALALLAVTVTGAYSQRKKGEDQNARSVQGVVEDPQGKLVEGAVVQLKNTKSLQVRSFITQKEGNYYFHGLNPDVEYELKAEFKELSSPVRRLSVFDSRRNAVINLKLAPSQ